MPFGSAAELPANIRDQLNSDERALFVEVFNRVYAQTHDDEKAFAAAWGAVNKSRGQRSTVRAYRNADGKYIVRGWAMLFTDEAHTDAYDTFFDRASALLLDYYPSAPLWMEHGQDKDYGSAPIGRRSHAEIYGHGIWLEHELHENHPCFDQTRRGVEEGQFSYSSDSVGHYVSEGFNPVNGHLGVWPFVGCSLTRSPAEPGLGKVSLRAFKSFVDSLTEAREAQSRGQIRNQGVKIMDPEMLAALAEFFGVEATPEAVAAPLQELLTQLQGGEAESAMGDLRSALNMDETATTEDVIGRMQQIASMLGESGRSYNYDALRRFSGLAEVALDESEEEEMPYVTRKHGSNQPLRFNVNRGAKQPGLVDMLRNIRAMKTQSYQLGPTGGYILNHEIAAEILPALRDSIPLFDMGVQEYTMDGVESLTIPKDRSEQEAYWVGEDTEIPESEENIGGVTLYPRPLAARVIIPNKYLANSVVDYEARVREKVTYRIMRAIMRAALFGTGGVSAPNVGAQPVGLATLAGMTGRDVTLTTLGTGNGAKPKISDLTAAIGRIEDANVELDDTTAWLFAPRTKRFFTDMTDSTGQPVLRGSWAEREERELVGYPWETTTLIPINQTVGTSSDCSTIFAGVWRHLAVALSNQFEFLVDPYSRSSYLQTVIIASTYSDIAVLYDEAFEVIAGVRS